MLIRLACLAGALLLWSCSAHQERADIKNRQEVLENRVIALEKDLSKELKSPKKSGKAEGTELNRKYSILEGRIRRNAEDIKTLRVDFLASTNEMETQQKVVANLKETVALLSKRLSLLEVEIDALHASFAVTKKSGGPQGQANTDEETLYRNAVAKFKNEDYQASQRLFKEYIQKYPSGEYLSQSYYQSGQISFAQGRYKVAATDLWEVVRRFRTSSVFEDAEWLLAVALERGGDVEQAVTLYEGMVKQKGKHSKKAEVRLETLSP